MASFWKPEACGQTVLPDSSVLKGQKLVENAKSQKCNCDFLSNFQTMWANSSGEDSWQNTIFTYSKYAFYLPFCLLRVNSSTNGKPNSTGKILSMKAVEFRFKV